MRGKNVTRTEDILNLRRLAKRVPRARKLVSNVQSGGNNIAYLLALIESCP